MDLKLATISSVPSRGAAAQVTFPGRAHSAVDSARLVDYEPCMGSLRTEPSAPVLGFSTRRRFMLDVLIDEQDRVELLRAEARRGLTRRPKELPPKWFYDARGSALFDAITRLPEYYLTRASARSSRARAGGDRRRSRGARHAGRARLRHLGEDAHPARRARRGGDAGALRAVRRLPADAARMRGAALLDELSRASRSTRSSATSSCHLGAIAARGRRRWWRSSAAPSATSPAPERAALLGDAAAGMLGPATASCSAPTWSRKRAPRRRLQRRRGRDRGVQQERAARAEPRSRRRLRPRSASTTWPRYDPELELDRDRLRARVAQRCTCARSA